METRMVWALYDAVQQYSGTGMASVSQLGADFKVSLLKKEAQFRTTKLQDILLSFEELFELRNDSGNVMVSLIEGGEEFLPDLDEHLVEEIQESTRSDQELPERIHSPGSAKERMQALRIEIIHALHRRGGKAEAQGLGQDHLVQQCKERIYQARKLSDFLRIFPKNFGLTTSDAGGFIVELLEAGVADQTMIENSIQRNQDSYNSSSRRYGAPTRVFPSHHGHPGHPGHLGHPGHPGPPQPPHHGHHTHHVHPHMPVGPPHPMYPGYPPHFHQQQLQHHQPMFHHPPPALMYGPAGSLSG